MRYRKLDAAGDYQLGGAAAFLINSPDAVAQAIKTRLSLNLGEWFTDTSDGTPWQTEILGHRFSGRTPDAAIKARILGTQGVTQITAYSTSFDGNTRKLTITATVDTDYGAATLTQTL